MPSQISKITSTAEDVVTDVAWSPNQEHFGFIEYDEEFDTLYVDVRETDTESQVFFTDEGAGKGEAIEMSDKWVFYGTSNGDLFIGDYEADNVETLISPNNASGTIIDISIDTQKELVSWMTSDGYIIIANFGSWSIKEEFAINDDVKETFDYTNPLAMVPGTEYLAYGSTEDAYLYDYESGSHEGSITWGLGIDSVAVGEDVSMEEGPPEIMSSASAGEQYFVEPPSTDWSVVPLDNERTYGDYHPYSTSWTLALASPGSSVQIYSDNGEDQDSISVDSGDVTSAKFSPGGDKMLLGSTEGEVEIYDIPPEFVEPQPEPEITITNPNQDDFYNDGEGFDVDVDLDDLESDGYAVRVENSKGDILEVETGSNVDGSVEIQSQYTASDGFFDEDGTHTLVVDVDDGSAPNLREGEFTQERTFEVEVLDPIIDILSPLEEDNVQHGAQEDIDVEIDQLDSDYYAVRVEAPNGDTLEVETASNVSSFAKIEDQFTASQGFFDQDGQYTLVVDVSENQVPQLREGDFTSKNPFSVEVNDPDITINSPNEGEIFTDDQEVGVSVDVDFAKDYYFAVRLEDAEGDIETVSSGSFANIENTVTETFTAGEEPTHQPGTNNLVVDVSDDSVPGIREGEFCEETSFELDVEPPVPPLGSKTRTNEKGEIATDENGVVQTQEME